MRIGLNALMRSGGLWWLLLKQGDEAERLRQEKRSRGTTENNSNKDQMRNGSMASSADAGLSDLLGDPSEERDDLNWSTLEPRRIESTGSMVDGPDGLDGMSGMDGVDDTDGLDGTNGMDQMDEMNCAVAADGMKGIDNEHDIDHERDIDRSEASGRSTAWIRGMSCRSWTTLPTISPDPRASRTMSGSDKRWTPRWSTSRPTVWLRGEHTGSTRRGELFPGFSVRVAAERD